jgi:hypothetical protein
MNRTGTQSFSLSRFTRRYHLSRGLLFGGLILGALLAFELFNYSTTDFALNDLLGGLRFAGIRWATILAIAFCGIDFAGIARLFTPEQGADEPKEVWYLFGAWLLAAAMNAMLTWWGVSIAIISHQSLGDAVIARDTLIEVVPVFVAVMVWLIRVLIIGTFSVAGDRLYSQADISHKLRPTSTLNPANNTVRPVSPQPSTFRPLPKITTESGRPSFGRPEPTYHPAGMSGYQSGNSKTRQ